jgi:predicted TIM-barrel fold metal-dependent hydrolase
VTTSGQLEEEKQSRLIIVSGDSHAGMLPASWEEYLEPGFHHLLPAVREEAVVAPTALHLVNARNRATELDSYAEAHRSGWHGLHDPALRLAAMDAEGVAAELVYHGDSRLHELFFSVTNRAYPFDAWHAGAKAWNRWASDSFGAWPDRFLLTAAVGPCVDMEVAVAELRWVADAGFTATYMPGYVTHPATPPLHDEHWEPFWSACEDLGLAVVVHAGYGTEQGALYAEMERIFHDAARVAGTSDPDAVRAHPEAVRDESKAYLAHMANHSLPARRPLWQLTLGGVFDRHPRLRLLLSEIRVDWIPPTLAFLDRQFQRHHDVLPTDRPPSEHWRRNCAAVASFVHRAEVGMLAEVGADNVLFGRDYPHSEGTWPHTDAWLGDACAGLSEAAARRFLGENAIAFLGLDRARLVPIAERVGPTVGEVTGAPDIPEELIRNFSRRGGYLKPLEGDRQLDALALLVDEDLARIRRG